MLFNHIRKSTRHKFFFDFFPDEFLDSRQLFLPQGGGTNGKERKRTVNLWRELAPRTFDVTTERNRRALTTSGGSTETESKEILEDESYLHEDIGPSTATASLRYLALRGSELHREVVDVLMRMPDVWAGGKKVYEGEAMKNRDQMRCPIRWAAEEVGPPLKIAAEEQMEVVGESQGQAQGNGARFAVHPSPGFVYATMVYGATFRVYLPSWIHRWREVLNGRHNFLIFTMDAESFAVCKSLHVGCVGGGTPGIMQKFTIPWVLARNDVDVVWVDFDVFPMRDPTYAILEHQNRNNYEILISSDRDFANLRKTATEKNLFASPCICNGIVYFKSSPNTVLWLVDVLHWMYEHPYEHDQKCFSAYLNYTEPVTMDWADLPRSGPLPHWDTLDPVRQFVTALVVRLPRKREGERKTEIDRKTSL
eukprot:g5091.t1